MNPPENMIDLLARVVFSYFALPSLISFFILLRYSDWRATDISKQLVYLLGIIASIVLITIPFYLLGDFPFRDVIRLGLFGAMAGVLTRMAWITIKRVLLPRLRSGREEP